MSKRIFRKTPSNKTIKALQAAQANLESMRGTAAKATPAPSARYPERADTMPAVLPDIAVAPTSGAHMPRLGKKPVQGDIWFNCPFRQTTRLALHVPCVSTSDPSDPYGPFQLVCDLAESGFSLLGEPKRIYTSTGDDCGTVEAMDLDVLVGTRERPQYIAKLVQHMEGHEIPFILVEDGDGPPLLLELDYDKLDARRKAEYAIYEAGRKARRQAETGFDEDPFAELDAVAD